MFCYTEYLLHLGPSYESNKARASPGAPPRATLYTPQCTHYTPTHDTVHIRHTFTYLPRCHVLANDRGAGRVGRVKLPEFSDDGSTPGVPVAGEEERDDRDGVPDRLNTVQCELRCQISV